MLALKFSALAFSALLPLINPLGSALLFLSVVGNEPPQVFRQLTRKVAVSTVLFLLVIELAGSALLSFFGISLPVVQFAGGFVLATMGLQLLNGNGTSRTEKEKLPSNPNSQNGAADQRGEDAADDPAYVSVTEKIFYPLTFPITAGPGCIVVTATLSAHASRYDLVDNIVAHLGIAAAIVVLGVTVWISYAYAPRVTRKISPQTAHGIQRVIAFVLLCIGVQIGWNGLEAMLKTMPK